MPKIPPPRPEILVIGDAHVDVVVVPVASRSQSKDNPLRNWETQTAFREFRRLGGAWLLSDLVEISALERSTTYTKKIRYHEHRKPLLPVSTAVLDLFDQGGENNGGKVYRLPSSRSVGWYRGELSSLSKQHKDHSATLRALLASVSQEVKPRLLVIHDHNNGFRDIPLGESLLQFLDGNFNFPGTFDAQASGMILWHTDAPCQGQLWDALCGTYADRVVAVVNEDDLRHSGIAFKDDLSIEQTANDFLDLLHRSPLSDLARCSCVVVRFSNGAMIYEKPIVQAGRQEAFTISYLPEGKRSTAVSGEHTGLMVGYSLLLASAIAKGIHWSQNTLRDKKVDAFSCLSCGIRSGVELGICYAQWHFRKGFLPENFERVGSPHAVPRGAGQSSGGNGRDTENEPQPYRDLISECNDLVKLKVGDAVKPPAELVVATVDFKPAQIRNDRKWQRVSLLERHESHEPGDLESQALSVVRKGFKGMAFHSPKTEDIGRAYWAPLSRMRCPYFGVGRLLLIDREEIDDFESIGALVSQYLRTASWIQPLSIAVFGPPGSGKSFAVREVFASARAGIRKAGLGSAESRPLQFNLSQFRDFEDLATAFHQVQDKAIGGDVPLVMFDEFDTEMGGAPLGWLKYFLAPMQDGEFRHRDLIYQVGRAVFVFAGGTHNKFSEFYHTKRLEDRDFKTAKGPDFVSRLRGHLNIQGVNPSNDGGGVTEVMMMRRAILLHEHLRRHCSKVFRDECAQIEAGVAHAFLQIGRYEHGARSMEAIVQMADITSRGWFEKASVPHANQLAMHVDAAEFMRLVNSK